MRGEEERFCQRRGAEDHDGVVRFHPRSPGNDRMRAVESPVRRLPLRFAQGPVFLPPPRERRQPQPLCDNTIDVLEQQHLGEQVLILRGCVQLAHGLIADLQQLGARHGVLVLLESLQDELLIFLLERAGRPAHRRHARLLAGALEGKGSQHGSTCTVTSSSSSSFLSFSSTASAMACAAATFAFGSTAMVTSA